MKSIPILIALVSALFLCNLASSEKLANELADFGFGLDAQVSFENSVLLSSPQVITVQVVADNPYGTPMPIYLLRQLSERNWEIVKLVGALPPGETTQIDIEVEVEYDNKQLTKKTRYALVGRGDDSQLRGIYFELNEDWTAYKNDIRNTLSGAMLTMLPIVGTLLVVLLVIMAGVAYSSKSRGLVSGEYTMKTLVFPEVRGRPFEEKLADLMIHPATIFFELACVVILVFVMYETVAGASGADEALTIIVLSGIGSLSIPLVYLAASWYFEKREEGKPLRFFAGMFGWGMFAAFLSLIISSGLVSELRGMETVSYAVIAIMFIAPVVEETTKGIGVLFMSGHHEYNDTLTGLLLGFTCGAGFAFVENWFYFSAKANPFEIGLVPWGTLIIYRSFFNTLAHGCFTAAVSTAIGYVKSVGGIARFARLAFAPGIFFAVAIHSIFNMSALADGFMMANRQVPFYIFNPMLIILLAAMFFLVLVLATTEEKKKRVAASAEAKQGGGDMSGGGAQ